MTLYSGGGGVTDPVDPPNQEDEPQESTNSMILAVDTTSTNGIVNLGYNLGRWKNTNEAYSDIPHAGTIDWGDGNSTKFDGTEGIEDNESNRLYHVYKTPDTYEITIEGTVKWNYIIEGFSTTSSAPNSLLQTLKKIKIPEGKKSPIQVINNYGFNGCTNLQEIPSELFEYCTTTKSFYFCFCGCRNLQEIPSGLFDHCSQALSFSYCFRSCNQLKKIPNGLFKTCSIAQDFANCFAYCTNLQEIPSELFEYCTQIRAINSCFQGCSNISKNLPLQLWEKYKNISYTQCFCDCVNAPNYNDAIKKGWTCSSDTIS